MHLQRNASFVSSECIRTKKWSQWSGLNRQTLSGLHLRKFARRTRTMQEAINSSAAIAERTYATGLKLSLSAEARTPTENQRACSFSPYQRPCKAKRRRRTLLHSWLVVSLYQVFLVVRCIRLHRPVIPNRAIPSGD